MCGINFFYDFQKASNISFGGAELGTGMSSVVLPVDNKTKYDTKKI